MGLRHFHVCTVQARDKTSKECNGHPQLVDLLILTQSTKQNHSVHHIDVVTLVRAKLPFAGVTE